MVEFHPHVMNLGHLVHKQVESWIQQLDIKYRVVVDFRQKDTSFYTDGPRGKVPIVDDPGWDHTGLGTKAILTEILGREAAEEVKVDADGSATLLAGVVLRLDTSLQCERGETLDKV